MTTDDMKSIRQDLAVLSNKHSRSAPKPQDKKIKVSFSNKDLMIYSKDRRQPIRPVLSGKKLRKVLKKIIPSQVEAIRTHLVNLDLCFGDLFTLACKCENCEFLAIGQTCDSTDCNQGIVKGLEMSLKRLSRLMSIDIRDTCLGEGGRQVLSALSCAHLRVLTLHNNGLKGCGPQLAACLTRLPLLAWLSLNNSGLTGEEMPGVLHSLAANCPQLVALLLGADLSQAGEALTRAVQAKSRLKILDVAWCKLDSSHLGNALKGISADIEYLHIWGNPVFMDVETELVRVIEQRPSLRYVAVDETRVSAGAWDRMESVLRARRGHLYVSIQGSDEFKRDVEYLAKVRDQCLLQA